MFTVKTKSVTLFLFCIIITEMYVPTSYTFGIKIYGVEIDIRRF